MFLYLQQGDKFKMEKMAKHKLNKQEREWNVGRFSGRIQSFCYSFSRDRIRLEHVKRFKRFDLTDPLKFNKIEIKGFPFFHNALHSKFLSEIHLYFFFSFILWYSFFLSFHYYLCNLKYKSWYSRYGFAGAHAADCIKKMKMKRTDKSRKKNGIRM